MSIPTQGTDGFILVPSLTNIGTCEVVELGCVTAIDPGTDSADQIENTCLKVRTTRTYVPGLTTPGQGSISLNVDPQEPAHVRLFELSKTKETIKFAIGWSDGPETSIPTATQAGGIRAVAVTNGGTGYTTAPTVAISGGGGTGATAVATVSGGTVTGISVTNSGSGYIAPVTVTITGAGTGAVAAAEVSTGCDFILPEDRTFNVFDGYVSGFPFTFAQNALVQSTVAIQRSGDNFWYTKVV